MKIKILKRIKPALSYILIGVVLTISVGYQSGYFEIAKQLEIFNLVFKTVNTNYISETNPAELMEKSINKMLHDLDPYTRFMNEQDVEAYRIKQQGSYGGIGVKTRYRKDKIIIMGVNMDTPADKAGLKAGDKITAIDGVKVSDYKAKEVKTLLRGTPDTEVILTISRQGKILKKIVIRQEVIINPVPYYAMATDNVGYIPLVKFNKKTTKQVKEALVALKKQGANKIILDLRGNPGGLLSQAVSVVNLFIPKGQLVVDTRSRVEKYNKEYKTRGAAFDTEIPLIVIVNNRSASASEIVSGTLQDLDRAVIIGDRSFGKGLVQRPINLAYGTQMKLTISKYYTPSGRCIQEIDYWNRDSLGKPQKYNVNKRQAFKTKNGRTVYDGGGVTPDVKVQETELSKITKLLLRDDIFVDFATKYYYNHSNLDVKNFTFSDTDFNTFITYVKDHNFSTKSKTEKYLDKLMSTAKDDDLDKDIKANTLALNNTIKQAKITALSTHKEEIKKLFTDELIKRFAYRKGLYEYQLTHDLEIKKGIELLNNEAKIKKILKS